MAPSPLGRGPSAGPSSGPWMAYSWICLLVAVPCLLLSACATARPGTGDISFRLRWEGTSDLDLHVYDPAARHIGVTGYPLYEHGPGLAQKLADAVEEGDGQPGEVSRIKASGEVVGNSAGPAAGILDIDCNADPERICAKPIENIFWPEDTAPKGDYRVRVHLFQQVYGPAAVPFELEVRRGRRVAKVFRGIVDPDNKYSETFSVSY